MELSGDYDHFTFFEEESRLGLISYIKDGEIKFHTKTCDLVKRIGNNLYCSTGVIHGAIVWPKEMYLHERNHG